MIFTVIWKPSAVNDPATLWTTATDRNAVAHASDLIDALLRLNPQQHGEPRAGISRILIVPSLGVDCDVNEDDRMVTVTGVWLS